MAAALSPPKAVPGMLPSLEKTLDKVCLQKGIIPIPKRIGTGMTCNTVFFLYHLSRYFPRSRINVWIFMYNNATTPYFDWS